MAGGAGGIRAGAAYVEAFFKDNQLVAGLNAAESRMKAFGGAVAGVGAKVLGAGTAFLTPFLGAAKVFADTGSELNDMSARTGLSVENLSELGHAAQQTGTDLETVEGGVRKMQKNLIAAAQGGQEAQVAFGSLGLSVGKLMRLKPDQQFEAVAAAIGQIKNPTAKAAAAMQVLGKSGTALLPLIDDYDALAAEARDLGLVMSTEDAKAADTLGDAMDNVTAMLKRTAVVVGAALAPMLTELAGSVMRVVKTAIDWVNANRPLVTTIFQIGVAVTAAGAALVALGVSISAAGSVLGGVAAGIGLIGTVLGALLSPIGLVAAAVAGLGTWFVTSTEAGGRAVEWLGARFGDLKTDATTAFGGIADALAAGDLAGAGAVAMAALKVEWARGTLLLTQVWADWGAETLATVMAVTDNVKYAFSVMVDGLKAEWKALGDFMQPLWDRLTGGSAGAGGVLKGIGAGLLTAAIPAGLGPLLMGPPGAEGAGLGAAAAQAFAPNAQQQEDVAKAGQDAQGGVAKALADLEAAKAGLNTAVTEAAQKRAAAAGPAGAKKPGGPEIDAAAVDEGVQQAKAKVDVKGSFNAAALRGLGAGDSVVEVAKEQKKEAEKQTKELKTLNDKARAGRLVFTS